jgi:hypothetical protein
MGVFFRPIINFKISNHVLFFFFFRGRKAQRSNKTRHQPKEA